MPMSYTGTPEQIASIALKLKQHGAVHLKVDGWHVYLTFGYYSVQYDQYRSPSLIIGVPSFGCASQHWERGKPICNFYVGKLFRGEYLDSDSKLVNLGNALVLILDKIGGDGPPEKKPEVDDSLTLALPEGV